MYDEDEFEDDAKEIIDEAYAELEPEEWDEFLETSDPDGELDRYIELTYG